MIWRFSKRGKQGIVSRKIIVNYIFDISDCILKCNQMCTFLPKREIISMNSNLDNSKLGSPEQPTIKIWKVNIF